MEQRVDVGPVACIGDERCCAGFGGNGIKGLATARRDRDAHSALAREGARETRTEAGAGTDDQRAPIRRHSHTAA